MFRLQVTVTLLPKMQGNPSGLLWQSDFDLGKSFDGPETGPVMNL